MLCPAATSTERTESQPDELAHFNEEQDGFLVVGKGYGRNRQQQAGVRQQATAAYSDSGQAGWDLESIAQSADPLTVIQGWEAQVGFPSNRHCKVCGQTLTTCSNLSLSHRGCWLQLHIGGMYQQHSCVVLLLYAKTLTSMKRGWHTLKLNCKNAA